MTPAGSRFAHARKTASLHFFMRRMLAAPVAELLQFKPVRLRFTILRSRIVPLFAITALHRNDLSGHCLLLLFFVEPRASPPDPHGRHDRASMDRPTAQYPKSCSS